MLVKEEGEEREPTTSTETRDQAGTRRGGGGRNSGV